MRLLSLVDSPDHVCCRYRIRAFEPALQDAGWSLTCQAIERSAFARMRQFRAASDYDAVILQRKLLPRWQLNWLRSQSRYLVFDFDDAVLYRDSYAAGGPHSARRASLFAATVRTVDTVVAGNDFLADCASRSGAPAERVRVIPTCIDPAHYASPHVTTPGDIKRKTEGLELVWIGSASTLQGLEQQRALMERLGNEIPGVRLRVICDHFPSFAGLPVVGVPWSEQTEADELAASDVGISLLPDDLWSRGKCGLKILQYQAAGLPVVANPVGSHVELIEPGVTGYLAETAGEWVEALRTLSADPGLRRRMGQIARQRVERGFSVEAWAETLLETLPTTTKSSCEDAFQRDLRESSIRESKPSRARQPGFFRDLAAIQGSDNSTRKSY